MGLLDVKLELKQPTSSQSGKVTWYAGIRCPHHSCLEMHQSRIFSIQWYHIFSWTSGMILRWPVLTALIASAAILSQRMYLTTKWTNKNDGRIEMTMTRWPRGNHCKRWWGPRFDPQQDQFRKQTILNSFSYGRSLLWYSRFFTLGPGNCRALLLLPLNNHYARMLLSLSTPMDNRREVYVRKYFSMILTIVVLT